MKKTCPNLDHNRSFRPTAPVAAFLAVLLALISAAPVLADRDDKDDCDWQLQPRVIPAQARPYGKTYAQWSAEWWQWALALPVAGHPFVDDPGFRCDVGQSGPVWFIGSPFGTTERTCAVPAGHAVLFALLNAECSDLEGLGATALEQRACATDFANHIRDLFCTIDGVPVRNLQDFRFVSPQFQFTAPTPWIFGDTGGPGTAVSDGYFVMLPPMAAGTHTIRYGGRFVFTLAEDGFDAEFALDTTYHLNIVQPARIAPPRSRPFGKTYGEWAAKWWQWALSIPADRNPLTDTTGEFADEEQGGPVWFAPGTFGTSAERSFTVPQRKAIFLPVSNWIFGSGAFDCDPTVPGVPCDVQALQASAAANTEAAEVLEVTIDGLRVPNVRRYRGTSPEPFALVYPENSVTGVPAGTYYPQVADGYWLMIAPLSRGAHEIRVYVKAPGTVFGLIEYEIVHHLTVE